MRLLSILFLFFIAFSTGAFAQNEEKEITYDLYIFIHESCKISQFYMPLLDSLHSEYKESTRFIGVFPNVSSTVPGIDSFQSQYGIEFQFLLDHDKQLTKKYEVTVTPEIVLVEKSTDHIVYKGRIDDSYFRVGKRKTVKQTQELIDLLDSISEGKQINVLWAPAIGCFIQM